MRNPLLAFPAVLALAAAGCGDGGKYDWRPADVEVLRSAVAPTRTRSALLVRSVSRAALSSDTYKVAVVAGRSPATAAAAARLADTAFVLHATAAAGVQLWWASDTALTLVRSGCGLEAFDVLERRDRLGPVRVSYEGFPRGTADAAW